MVKRFFKKNINSSTDEQKNPTIFSLITVLITAAMKNQL